MKKWKKCLALFMSAAVLFTGGMLPQKNAATAERAADYGISSPRIENGVTTWDKIKFGSYYQDGEVQPAEPIKWRVLSVNGDDAFLLADRCLDAKAYEDTGYESVWDAWSETDDKYSAPWEICSLREWLNEDFYNEAFDDDEKNAIRETTVINDFNGKYYNATTDKVYLLSVEEVHNEAYGFEPFNTEDEDEEESVNDVSKTREAKDTDYARINSVIGEIGAMLATTNSYWWLRSSGYYSEDNSRRNPNPNEGWEYAYACQVAFAGQCFDYSGNVGDSGISVRPALHVNLSSPKVKAAGKVDSEGNVTMSDGGINNPVVKDGVTTWDCVYFGNYKQNFSVKQAIEWRVLSVDGDDAFLLADKSLGSEPYDYDENIQITTRYTTWEQCSIRKWLNENFYNEAFDDEEKKAVRETVLNNDAPDYGTEGGIDTIDKVYLLSIAEASNAAYGFDTEFEKSSKTREEKTTDYARANGAWIVDDDNGGWGWWLRTSANNEYRTLAAFVLNYGDGFGGVMGEYVECSFIGVRPALHINLSSSSWSKAGQVTAERGSDDVPTDEPTENPTASPEPTKEPSPTDKPTQSTTPGQTTPTVTAQPTLPPAETQNPASELKQFKLTSVKCAKNTKKITGKVSVFKASVKIKVGKKAYKKAAVKGKKFTLKLNYKLKKKTKVIIKADKKGYKSLVKSYTVK